MPSTHKSITDSTNNADRMTSVPTTTSTEDRTNSNTDVSTQAIQQLNREVYSRGETQDFYKSVPIGAHINHGLNMLSFFPPPRGEDEPENQTNFIQSLNPLPKTSSKGDLLELSSPSVESASQSTLPSTSAKESRDKVPPSITASGKHAPAAAAAAIMTNIKSSKVFKKIWGWKVSYRITIYI